jgi:hypothetical protein
MHCFNTRAAEKSWRDPVPQALTFLLHCSQSIFGVDIVANDPQPIAMQHAV